MNTTAAATLIAALSLAAPAIAGTAETKAFGEARLAAFGTGDIEALLAQYADDAVIVAPDGIHDSADSRRGFVTGVLAAMGQPDLEFEIVRIEASGDILQMVWKAETGTMDFGTGVETYVLRDGKAIYHTEYNVAVAK